MKQTLILTVMFAAATALADNRIFTYSYEPETEPKGDWELEQQITSRLTRNRAVGQENYQKWQFRSEVEYGATDRWTTSVAINDDYEHFRNPGTGQNHDINRFSGISFENRYNVLDAVENPVGLTLYLEPTWDGQNAELEQKIILGQRHGDWKWALNISHATEWEGDINNYEGELIFSAGLARKLTERWTLGLEVRDDNELPMYQQWENSAVFLGPTLSYHRQKWWAAFSVLPQIYGWNENNSDGNTHLDLDGHERWNLRLIVGYSF